LIPISSKEWKIIKKYNSYGVPLNHRATSRIAKGDILVFYVTKTSSKVLGGNIVGVFEVTSNWEPCNENVLPKEECERYPVRISVKPIVIGKASLWDNRDKLTFIKRKENPSYYLKGTPANGNRPIPQKDLETIVNLLTNPQL